MYVQTVQGPRVLMWLVCEQWGEHTPIVGDKRHAPKRKKAYGGHFTVGICGTVNLRIENCIYYKRANSYVNLY